MANNRLRKSATPRGQEGLPLIEAGFIYNQNVSGAYNAQSAPGGYVPDAPPNQEIIITTVVFANRAYAVLKREFSYLGAGQPGPIASTMFDIGNPDLDWTLLAKGMGVPASRATSMHSFSSALREGFSSQGPRLIQVDV